MLGADETGLTSSLGGDCGTGLTWVTGLGLGRLSKLTGDAEASVSVVFANLLGEIKTVIYLLMCILVINITILQ